MALLTIMVGIWRNCAPCAYRKLICLAKRKCAWKWIMPKRETVTIFVFGTDWQMEAFEMSKCLAARFHREIRFSFSASCWMHRKKRNLKMRRHDSHQYAQNCHTMSWSSIRTVTCSMQILPPYQNSMIYRVWGKNILFFMNFAITQKNAHRGFGSVKPGLAGVVTSNISTGPPVLSI